MPVLVAILVLIEQANLSKEIIRVAELEQFIDDKKCLVVGSSWPKDIEVMKQWLQAK